MRDLEAEFLTHRQDLIRRKFCFSSADVCLHGAGIIEVLWLFIACMDLQLFVLA